MPLRPRPRCVYGPDSYPISVAVFPKGSSELWPPVNPHYFRGTIAAGYIQVEPGRDFLTVEQLQGSCFWPLGKNIHRHNHARFAPWSQRLHPWHGIQRPFLEWPCTLAAWVQIPWHPKPCPLALVRQCHSCKVLAHLPHVRPIVLHL